MHSQSSHLQYLAICSMSRANATKPNLRQVMWISHCGKPVSVCDGSDSDCWLMECGYITCVRECVHGGCNPPPLSCVPVAQHKHNESQHQTLRSLWSAQTRRNQASWLIVDYNETHCICSLLTSAFYGPGSKVAPFARS